MVPHDPAKSAKPAPRQPCAGGSHAFFKTSGCLRLVAVREAARPPTQPKSFPPNHSSAPHSSAPTPHAKPLRLGTGCAGRNAVWWKSMIVPCGDLSDHPSGVPRDVANLSGGSAHACGGAAPPATVRPPSGRLWSSGDTQQQLAKRLLRARALCVRLAHPITEATPRRPCAGGSHGSARPSQARRTSSPPALRRRKPWFRTTQPSPPNQLPAGLAPVEAMVPHDPAKSAEPAPRRPCAGGSHGSARPSQVRRNSSPPALRRWKPCFLHDFRMSPSRRGSRGRSPSNPNQVVSAEPFLCPHSSAPTPYAKPLRLGRTCRTPWPGFGAPQHRTRSHSAWDWMGRAGFSFPRRVQDQQVIVHCAPGSNEAWAAPTPRRRRENDDLLRCPCLDEARPPGREASTRYARRGAACCRRCRERPS